MGRGYLSSLESTLNQLKFLDFVGWFINEKGFQRDTHIINNCLIFKRIMKLSVCRKPSDDFSCFLSLVVLLLCYK